MHEKKMKSDIATVEDLFELLHEVFFNYKLSTSLVYTILDSVSTT
jgi:hypothetical protein